MKISAVLITRESKYPQDAWPVYPFDEVLVETNCPHVRRRFELAECARNDHIYVQDDDVAQVDIARLATSYDLEHVTHYITQGHMLIYAGTGVTLIGWGALFPKKLIDWRRWEERYGEVDPIEADRIFTFLNQPHKSLYQFPVHQIHRAIKLSDRENHYRDRDATIRKLKELEVKV